MSDTETPILTIKEGVKLAGLRPPAVTIVLEAMKVWAMLGVDRTTITSAARSWGVPHTLHNEGLAVDIRRHNLPEPTTAVELLQRRLGNDYDVILEDTHIHAEYDPERTSMKRCKVGNAEASS